MKKYLVIKLIILFVYLSYSCQQKNRQNNSTGGIVVNLDIPEEMNIRASGIFKNARPIILETKSECLIETVSDIQVFEGEIFLLDRVGKSLFVFDKNGKFVRRIGKLGRGPGEYSSINDFTIDQVKREIYMLDGQKIFRYHVDGVFINAVRILTKAYKFFRSIQYFDGKIYATVEFPEENDHLLKVIDPVTGKILTGYLTPADRMGWNGIPLESGFFNRSHGIPRYTSLFMNTILSLEDMNPHITFESENFPTIEDVENIKRQITQKQFSAMIQLKKIRGIENYIETKDLIFFVYGKGNEMITALYKKDENKGYMVPYFNDLVFRIPFTVRCADEKGVYEVIDIDQIFACRDDLLVHDNLDIRKQLLALDENSNPVIFHYELKDK